LSSDIDLVFVNIGDTALKMLITGDGELILKKKKVTVNRDFEKKVTVIRYI